MHARVCIHPCVCPFLSHIPLTHPSLSHITGASGFGLSAAAAYAVDATAFAFGPASSWGFFTIYVLASSGALYALCPVAPFGESLFVCSMFIGAAHYMTRVYVCSAAPM